MNPESATSELSSDERNVYSLATVLEQPSNPDFPETPTNTDTLGHSCSPEDSYQKLYAEMYKKAYDEAYQTACWDSFDRSYKAGFKAKFSDSYMRAYMSEFERIRTYDSESNVKCEDFGFSWLNREKMCGICKLIKFTGSTKHHALMESILDKIPFSDNEESAVYLSLIPQFRPQQLEQILTFSIANIYSDATAFQSHTRPRK
ncbi:uncharacterized protein EAF01_011459 [Botrytis porri]|uniref:Uncharacterized protein n=1 Tax=Botrytis porri TaxID=87229 RepID=A0A4Z1KP70_9HELO|nr:uncharacterized protein EAF01_011459 [Botrytis porri]KAF7885395.1 hypothetical protein EAF01_011459 [Botrytis porri]TGO87791.1 hypothetical protein BPOR_0203g00090 [Botrytis porri]